jgi:1-acyl-sn-glycerol-3-phosphate acyltransferase
MRDKNKKMGMYRKYARLWGYLLTSALPFKVDVSGLENIPHDTNVIFTPNHQSYLDIFILLRYIPVPFRYIIMRSLFKFPLIGSHITKSGFLSLDRKDRKRSIKTIHEIIDILGMGESFVIFPEGVLTKDGSLGQFGRGTSIIIQRSRKPVVPVAIDGTFGVLPKGAWIMNPSTVRLKFGRPVMFKEYYNDISKHTSRQLGGELRQKVLALKEKAATAA